MNVIITGASRGMGKAMAIKFASVGYDLILCSKNVHTLNETKSTISKQFPLIDIKVFAADLAIKEETQSFGKFCLQYDAPDILINNAGTYTPGKCMDEPDGFMENILNLNFYSAYHLTRVLLPSMIKKGKGHIFNMCSVASLKAYEGGGSYSVSKFAMYGFSQNLRLELMPHGIKVTSVFPGAVLTDSWGDLDNSNGRIMVVDDIVEMMYAATKLSPQAVVEEILIRPQLGDM